MLTNTSYIFFLLKLAFNAWRKRTFMMMGAVFDTTINGILMFFIDTKTKVKILF